MSLDFLAARGGLVSLGHAMFLGIGAYSTTIFSLNLGVSPFIATILSLLIGCFIGLLISYFIVV